MKKIEVTDIDFERNGVNVDFEDGDCLVNFTFREEDLPNLKKLVAELEEEFSDLKNMRRKNQYG